MITEKTVIGQVLYEVENAREILNGFGMHCVGCPSARLETVEEACQVHGIKVDELLKKLNANNHEVIYPNESSYSD